MRKNYKEGGWFAIPVSEGQFALGLMARTPRGHGAIGYFFGPYTSIPEAEKASHQVSRNDAIEIADFSDLAIWDGQWPILRSSERWDRSQWPVPDMTRIDIVTGRYAHLSRYDDKFKFQWEIVISVEDAVRFPEDCCRGSESLRIALEMLFADPPPLPRFTPSLKWQGPVIGPK